MGGTPINQTNWNSYINSTVRTASNVGQIYTSRSLKADLDPKNIRRESRDSTGNPNSTPIIVGLDVTGSMGDILNSMARDGLETLVKEIVKRKPVQDPHVMYMGIGDAFCDSVPLQVTQFETDEKLVDQLREIYLEEGGGGNDSEGYALAWYFANFKTDIDCFEKRNEKGFLFTIGDDGPTPRITKDQLRNIFGDTVESDIDGKTLYKMASEKYNIFHITVERGGYSSFFKDVHEKWQELLGERALLLKDYTKMGELIISILQSYAGVDKQTIIDSWDKSTSLVIADALTSDLSTSEATDLVVF